MQIHKVAVIGSGVMGSTIAAHLANAGIPSLLLDIVPSKLSAKEEAAGLKMEDRKVRNSIAEGNKVKLLKMNPAPLLVPEFADRIEVGNLSDDLARLNEVDWVIEVVVERLDIKVDLFKKIAAHVRPGTIVTSNTSGISLKAMVEELPESFTRYFLGTHFFNPPRYMKLLEIIPGPNTDPEIITFLSEFGERVLGKGVVLAKDTPNFIANRIGVFGLAVTLQEMLRSGLTVDEVDALTGPVMGRPKSASFRTVDLVGLDTFIHTANTVAVGVPAEKENFTLPEFMQTMLANGWLGDKTKQGFYKKSKGPQGKVIEVLDPHTMTYVPKKSVKFASLDKAKAAGGLTEKIRTLVNGKDLGAEFAWNVLKPVLLYAATISKDIADNISGIDEGMRWGFNWQMGPFEIWDALGVKTIADRVVAEGGTLPPLVEELLAKGNGRFYQKSESGEVSYFEAGKYHKKAVSSYEFSLKQAHKDGKKILGNAGASLIDLGDGVACLEFHSPSNSIGADILTMIHKSLAEVEKNFLGMVIGNQGKNFCVGANLMQILLEAEEENWDDLDYMVRQFQNGTMALKFAKKPVVAAPFGMTLGGGAEVCLHSHAIQASAETYMGLVEVGVGLIPGGGGTKEMAIRAMEGILPGVQVSPDYFFAKRFEIVAMAQVSTSAEKARQLGFLRAHDRYSMNPDHIILDAKARVIDLARNFRPNLPTKYKIGGAGVRATLEIALHGMREGNYISEHDQHIGKKIAFAMTGGDRPAGMLVDEQYLLDLEREAFMSLVGEPKTQDRIRHMLAKGKPLRN
ncbi:3-hydroxyacyl-CoA dehydrogenase/enoyl-CoA hydratase family protein [Desulfosporosinus nitroreducens]|uniref:3-hydroxyacyl-CoA dehydrogenase/enoyl-CoA hydratase family protein n=1 Tax=Desulfosporosinus nitroreducens TaxID=2018668 RepID=A0ABT8QND8_9FIRM|nr:3-hydroxyacyl-CoA dehydrogenase/enoyl-CoA hydratase family protein [Desulfosporosinus nitroreducens]MDO0822770.1 3-hydroxyacyl-CoA dehydrogenase/enoyl-CoA hydratase family protein [Desulfosporosinus nitroreducens]